MTPGMLLIAQRLADVARDLEAVATLADEYRDLPRWEQHTAELRRTAELGDWWAKEIRADQISAEHRRNVAKPTL